MQVNQPYKLYNIGTYMLFLVVVFLMFAFVFNTIMQASAGMIGFFFLLFILSLLTGSALFIFTLAPSRGSVSSMMVSQEDNNTEMEIHPQTELTVDAPEDKLFDVQSIIPVNAPSLDAFSDALLRNMAREFNFVQGIFYIKKSAKEDSYTCKGQYACFSNQKPADFHSGESLPGQVVKNKIIVSISNIPENYMPVVSGLGTGAPRELVFIPCKYNDEVIAIIEYATFETFTGTMEKNLSQLSEIVAENIINLNKEI